MSWGPPPDGYAALPVPPARAGGGWLLVLPLVFGPVGFLAGVMLLLMVALLAPTRTPAR